MSQRLVSLAFAVSLVGLSANASVLVVSPGGPFTQIQAAASAAVSGDVLLVKTGTYAGFSLANKSLVITADAGAAVTIRGRIKIESLSAAKEILISGLDAEGDFFIPVEAYQCLKVLDCAGTVRFQDCVFRGGMNPASCFDVQFGAVVTACNDVAFSHCTLIGADPASTTTMSAGRPGLITSGSRVVLDRCTLIGGDGGNNACNGPGAGEAGGAGLVVFSSAQVWMSATHCEAGNGGPGLGAFAGGNGGPGVSVSSACALHVLDCTLVPGLGGAPFGMDGVPINASPSAIIANHPGRARSMKATTVARATNSRSLSISGAPGDSVAIYASRAGDWTFDPRVNWVRCVGSDVRARFLRYGMLPGSGTLDLTVPIPPLAAGVEAQVVQLEALHRDLGGAQFFGSPRFTVIVDPAF